MSLSRRAGDGTRERRCRYGRRVEDRDRGRLLGAIVRLVGAGLPPGRLRGQAARGRRQAGGSEGRREPSHHAGPSVRAVPHLARVRLQPEAHRVPHEARLRRPRAGQVGTHHVGRGHRHHRGEDPGDPGEVRQRQRHRVRRHGSRGLPVRPGHFLRRVPHAVLPVLHERPGLLRAAQHDGCQRVRQHRLPGDRLRRLEPPALRRPRLHPPGAGGGVGQGAFGL